MEPAFGTKVKAGKRRQENTKEKCREEREERMTDSHRHTYWEVTRRN